MLKDRTLRRFNTLCEQRVSGFPARAAAADSAAVADTPTVQDARELSESPSSPTPVIAPADIPLTLPTPHLAESDQPAAWPAQILDFTHDAIIIWELDGAGIVYWNRAAEQLYGYSREEARGQVTHELLKTRLTGSIGDLETALARYGVWVGDLRHTRRDGQIVEVEARLALMAQERRPWLVLEVNRDVTDRNRAEAARQEMTRQLERARRRT